MKQHISKEQWDELSEEQKDELEAAGFDGKHYWHITIGVLIEFLGDDWWWMLQRKAQADEHWGIDEVKDFYEELTDALWEAVKEKLIKE